MPGFKHIKDYLNFNRSERNGMIVLFLILIGIILFNIMLPFFLPQQSYDFEIFKKEIILFREQQERLADSIRTAKKDQQQKKSPQLFHFNPNGLSTEKWKLLGLSEKQIRVIKNYEKKGGLFRKPEDLKKIYTISDQTYNQLLPYIIIPAQDLEKEAEPQQRINPFPFNPNNCSEDSLKLLGLKESTIKAIINYRTKGGKFHTPVDILKIYTMDSLTYSVLEPCILIPKEPKMAEHEQKPQIIELNIADTIDLQILKGIGPAYANRIIKYRELLGGYSAKLQLLEVYGIDSAKFLLIENQITVDQRLIKKININTAGIKTLNNHPYIDFYLAKQIIKRRSEEKFTAVDQLLEEQIIYRELFEKLKHYLCI